MGDLGYGGDLGYIYKKNTDEDSLMYWDPIGSNNTKEILTFLVSLLNNSFVKPTEATKENDTLILRDFWEFQCR